MTRGLMPGNIRGPAGSQDPVTDSGRARPEDVTEAYADLVYALCRRLARNEEEARDLFQDSFVRILRGLPSFEGRASLRTWLCQIVINCDRNRRRWWLRLRRNLPTGESLGPFREAGWAGTEPPDDAPGPERAVLSVEIRDRVEASLRALPRDQRIAVVLRDIEGMSYEEIAVSMGTEMGTVKSRIGRARASLRVLLADLVDSPGEGTSS
jgi:RNA polymerase sigma-70 factor (ECF subfamily)